MMNLQPLSVSSETRNHLQYITKITMNFLFILYIELGVHNSVFLYLLLRYFSDIPHMV